jgi:hypothetical protein
MAMVRSKDKDIELIVAHGEYDTYRALACAAVGSNDLASTENQDPERVTNKAMADGARRLRQKLRELAD